MFDNATNYYRKSGVAERRDLRFHGPFVEMFFGSYRPRRLKNVQRAVRPSIRGYFGGVDILD